VVARPSALHQALVLATWLTLVDKVPAQEDHLDDIEFLQKIKVDITSAF
jgi:hypothetical protein